MIWLFGLSIGSAEQLVEHQKVQSKTLNKEMNITTIWSTESNIEKGYWVVLMLHGLGDDEQGFLGNRAYFKEAKIPMIVISPQGDRGYWTDGLLGNYSDWALEALDLELKRLGLNPPPCRVAIAGVSMGGFGSLSIGLQNPDRFSMIAPLSPTDLVIAIEDMPQSGTRRQVYTKVWGEPIAMDKVQAVNPVNLVNSGAGKGQKIAYIIGEKEPRKFKEGAERFEKASAQQDLDLEMRIVPDGPHRWNPTWGAQSTRWWIKKLEGSISSECPIEAP